MWLMAWSEIWGSAQSFGLSEVSFMKCLQKPSPTLTKNHNNYQNSILTF